MFIAGVRARDDKPELLEEAKSVLEDADWAMWKTRPPSSAALI
jgi:hypothetical protein